MEDLITDSISALEGHISFKKTSFPDFDKPIDSCCKLTSIFPAKAKATTSGGEAK